MKIRYLSTTLAAVLGVAAAALTPEAKAIDGTMTFNGTVSASTCSIALNGGSGSSGTVSLPTVSTNAFKTANTNAAYTKFTVNLSGCSAGMKSASVYFEPGAGIDSATGNLLNQATSSPATNVEVQLGTTPNANGAINLANVTNAGVNTTPIANNAATLNFYASYYSTNASVGSGAVSSTVTYSMIYQ